MNEKIDSKVQAAYDKVDAYPEDNMRLSHIAEIIGIDHNTLGKQVRFNKITEYETELNRYIIPKLIVKKLIDKHSSAIKGWPSRKDLTAKYGLNKDTITNWCDKNLLDSEIDFVGTRRIPFDAIPKLEKLIETYLLQTKESIEVEIQGEKQRIYLMKSIARDIAEKLDYPSEKEKKKAVESNYALLMRWSDKGLFGIEKVKFRGYWNFVTEESKDFLMKFAYTIAMRKPREKLYLK